MTYKFELEDDGTLSLESAVFQALGAAAACWSDTLGTYDLNKVKVIGDSLVEIIREGKFQ